MIDLFQLEEGLENRFDDVDSLVRDADRLRRLLYAIARRHNQTCANMTSGRCEAAIDVDESPGVEEKLLREERTKRTAETGQNDTKAMKGSLVPCTGRSRIAWACTAAVDESEKVAVEANVCIAHLNLLVSLKFG
jgi:uncharacterized membrane protein